MNANRNRSRICAFALFGTLTAGLPAAVRAQETKPAQEEKKQGTGVVPPGVKLKPQMPAGAPPRPYPFPKAATRTLANGLRVYVVADREQPAITARLVLDAGAAHDPAGKPGVAEMTANLLTQGTAKRNAQQIAEAIDFVGGSLSASADKDGTYVTVTVVKKDLALALDLLSDVVGNAAFQEEELDRRREQLLSGLRVQYSDPDYLATVVFNRRLYGEHPYGLPDEGTPDSARALKRDDLVKFRDTYYQPGGALLAFAGDITPAAAFAAAEKYFGSWARKSASGGSATGAPQPAGPQGRRILLVDKPDAVQTQIRVGRIGLRRNSPDYIPLYVTNRIFGGGFNSRLSTEVRVRKGLTYDASSRFDSRKETGSFTASTFTRTEATVEATKLVVDLIEKMATGAVAREELDFARDYLAGVFPIQTETAEQVANRILTVEQYGLPADYNDTYREKILAVGPAEVKAMAEKYFDARNLDLVLVGNVGAFRDALKKEFPGAQIEEMPFDQVDLLAKDLRRPAEAAGAASPEALERGKAWLRAAAEAAGGAAVNSVESIEVAGTAQLSTPMGQFEGTTKLVAVYPDKLRYELTLPVATILQGFDGKVAWTVSPQGSGQLPESQNPESLRGIALMGGGLRIHRMALAGQAEASAAGEEEVEGKKLLVLIWTSPAGPVKLYLDPETKLMTGARYRSTSPQGAYESLQLWSDFRVVDGVKFPHRSVSYRDGAKFIDQSITELKFNTKPDISFSKP